MSVASSTLFHIPTEQLMASVMMSIGRVDGKKYERDNIQTGTGKTCNNQTKNTIRPYNIGVNL